MKAGNERIMRAGNARIMTAGYERITQALFAVFAFALVAAGCDSAVGSESPNQGHSYIVGIDISGSRTKAELDESKQLLDALIGRLQAGDHLTLIEVYQGGRVPARQWSDSIRAPRKAGV